MRRSTLLPAVLAVAILAPGAAQAADPRPDSARAAVERLRDRLGHQAVVDIDPGTGTPRHVARLDGFLSGPSEDEPVDVARRYVADHSTALDLDAGDRARLQVAGSYMSSIGVTHVTFTQTYGGIPAFDSFVRVNVARGGRVLNVVGSPAGDARLASTTPALSARAARAAAMRDAGAAGPVPEVAARRAGPALTTRFEDGEQARLVMIEGTRLAWYLSTIPDGAAGDYVYVVDANRGSVLWRQRITDDIVGSVWDYYPVARGGPADGHTQLARTFPTAWLAETATVLNGPNAHVYSDIADDDRGDAADEIASSGPGAWDYPASLRVGGGACAAFAPCTWNSAVPRSWGTGTGNLRQNATQVFYYVNRFHDWLAGAPFGFDSASGNFEGADRLEAQTLDGADTSDAPGGPPSPGGGFPDRDHVSNANMSTPPDGQRPRMQMYLFPGDGDTPDLNGGDDAAVVYHEYTHGLSNRLVTLPSGASGLIGHQARAMGEGWSDWYAMDYLFGHGLDAGAVNFGFFVNGSRPNRPDGTTLRSQSMNCRPSSATSTDGGDRCLGTTAAGDGGYTYGDLGKVAVDPDTHAPVPEVHADGEIWGQTLWQLRDRLRADLGEAPGLERARLLITEAMRLSPPRPSFLDMRDAILAADTANAGSDRLRIWDVFRERGMGFYASTDGADDVTPIEDFNPPPTTGRTPGPAAPGPAEAPEPRAGGDRPAAVPVAVPAQRIRSVLARGLVLRLTSDRAATATVSVSLDARTSRRTRHRGPAGRAKKTLSEPGRSVRVRVRLGRLPARAARTLRGLRTAGLSIRVRLAGADGSATTVRRHVGLRR
jgi:extracellular elastinolytic metalloproteinase